MQALQGIEKIINRSVTDKKKYLKCDHVRS